jgi:hypothetical protein
MKQTIFIPFLLPGMNEIIRESKKIKGNWSGYACQKRKIQGQICLFLNKLAKPYVRVWIDFVWIEKTRKRDPDNVAAGKKFILDALVKNGTIENDGWKYVVGWTDSFVVDKNNPGVQFTIKEV